MIPLFCLNKISNELNIKHGDIYILHNVSKKTHYEFTWIYILAWGNCMETVIEVASITDVKAIVDVITDKHFPLTSIRLRGVACISTSTQPGHEMTWIHSPIHKKSTGLMLTSIPLYLIHPTKIARMASKFGSFPYYATFLQNQSVGGCVTCFLLRTFTVSQPKQLALFVGSHGCC